MISDLDNMIETFEAAMRDRPDYPMLLLGLARTAAKSNGKRQAFQLAKKALGLAPGDALVAARARTLLSTLVTGYHVPMMNDVRRNQAWDAALRRAIQPGMLAFEIGTGAGMLAMMAARAGAKVVTCEKDPILADMARALCAANGLADRVQVVSKYAHEVTLGEDLERPADLLFCDMFGDSLFDFDPLTNIASVRKRLLVPGAPCVPGVVSLRLALANYRGYERVAKIDRACGFDISAFADFVPHAVRVLVGNPDVSLLSQPEEALRFDLALAEQPVSGLCTVTLDATQDGEADGVLRWIKLELDHETTLEPRPEPGAVFFSSMSFSPFAKPRNLRQGDAVAMDCYFGENKILTVERG